MVQRICGLNFILFSALEEIQEGLSDPRSIVLFFEENQLKVIFVIDWRSFNFPSKSKKYPTKGSKKEKEEGSY